MNKQMTPAEIELLQQSRLAPISAKAALVGVESGPCPPRRTFPPLAGLEVDYQLEFRRRLNGKISWLLALKNTVDVAS